MATLASAADRLVAAQIAYDKLVTGTSARVVVDQNGERIEYTAASAPRLQVYIDALKREIGATTSGENGPLRIVI